MGPDRAKALSLLLTFLVQPALAQAPGWHYSPLPGEGDRASLGCARGSTETEYTCLAVRCEDDYSAGLYVHSSRVGGDAGRWDMTLDREDRVVEAIESGPPYGGKILDRDGWLLDGMRHGSFVYLRHADDIESGFAYISLEGSFRAIEEALYWCAPRVPIDEQNHDPGVMAQDDQGEAR